MKVSLPTRSSSKTSEVLNEPEDFERWQEKFVKAAFKLAKCHHPHIVLERIRNQAWKAKISAP